MRRFSGNVWSMATLFCGDRLSNGGGDPCELGKQAANVVL